MNGQKIVLAGVTFTDPALPKLRDDILLTSGSLYLFDFGHSLGALSGVPANGASIYNIAWNEAADTIGSGDVTTLAGSFTNQALAADALFELSGKGGLHAIYSQVNNTNASRGARINIGTPVLNYVIANKTNSFYMSVWARRTRAALNTAHRYMEIGTGGNFLGFMSAAGNTAKTNQASNISGGANTVANRYSSLRASAGSGDTVSAASGAISYGNIGSGSGLLNISPSDIAYRLYCEDLTVSGRTYEEVDALDLALWQQAFASGGKFFGDTWTDPSTFP